jgi:tetratricopeptide (TPR) repeat protein
MYEAWDAVGTRRVRLARKALLVSEDCADAYVLLAEEIANTLGEARTFYEQGVAAGERAIGSQVFEEDVGHFWGITETRPYMRARAGLAMVLWRMGELQQAIEHYENLLRLNPNDNQGIRYLLAPLYLEVGADDKLEVLLDEHKDEISADLLYTRALWTFRREGPSKRATAALRTAIRQNPFVPAYLLGEKQLPQKLPDHVGRGDEDEAISYASMSRRLWSDNQEAMDWLKNAV